MPQIHLKDTLGNLFSFFNRLDLYHVLVYANFVRQKQKNEDSYMYFLILDVACVPYC